MKPFRRTGFNVPLNCPLPKCRARGSWGTLPHAWFSCFVLFASSKENEVASAKPASQLIVSSKQFRKISALCLPFLIAWTREEELERAQAARALPFPFGRKRKQKGPFCTARRQRQDEATLKPVRRTFPNSAAHAASDTWEGSFLPLPCVAGAKIPSRATQLVKRYAASACRKLLNAQSAAGNARFLQPFVT